MMKGWIKCGVLTMEYYSATREDSDITYNMDKP